MMEAEWLACRDGEELTHVVIIRNNRPPNLHLPQAGYRRKVRLFCCACCRRISHLLTPDEDLTLQVAEAFAERPGTYRQNRRPVVANAAVHSAIEGCAITTPHNVVAYLMEEAMGKHQPTDPVRVRERAMQADLFRDVFGNPFRPTTLGARPTPTVASLAGAAYQQRHLPSGHLDNDRLAVLADALEEAGCEDAEILSHLRSPGPHVRGCWAVDLVLGRQ